MAPMLDKNLPSAGNKGFTLIETMIAMGIFAIGILAVASMQITAMQGNRSARIQTEAVSLAAQKLEELTAVPYTDGQLAAGTHSESDAGPNNQFDIDWTVTEDSPLTDTKTISMTVSWDDTSGQRSAEFNHIVADL